MLYHWEHHLEILSGSYLGLHWEWLSRFLRWIYQRTFLSDSYANNNIFIFFLVYIIQMTNQELTSWCWKISHKKDPSRKTLSTCKTFMFISRQNINFIHYILVILSTLSMPDHIVWTYRNLRFLDAQINFIPHFFLPSLQSCYFK